MPDDTDQIRRDTEAKWSGALSAITKAIPTLLAAIAVSLGLFNGCRISHTADWVGQHLQDKQQQIDQLKPTPGEPAK